MIELIRVVVREMGSYEIRLRSGRRGALPKLELSLMEGDFTFELHQRAQIDALFARAASARLSMSPPSYAMGLDGTTDELSIGSGFNRSTFTWSCTVPKGSKSLGERRAQQSGIRLPTPCGDRPGVKEDFDSLTARAAGCGRWLRCALNRPVLASTAR